MRSKGSAKTYASAASKAANPMKDAGIGTARRATLAIRISTATASDQAASLRQVVASTVRSHSPLRLRGAFLLLVNF